MSFLSDRSPTREALSRGHPLDLSALQTKKLLQADLDFQIQATKLLGERALFALEKRDSAGGFAFSADSLTKFDDKTAQLRQVWLKTYNDMISVLTKEQMSRLNTSPIPPSFEESDNESGATGALIDAAISARLKDAKVLEVDTAQAIVERITGWAKTAGLIAGIPLFILGSALAAMGISSYNDLKSHIAAGNEKVDEQTRTAKAEMDKFIAAQQSTLKAKTLEYNQKFETVFATIDKTDSSVRQLTDKIDKIEEVTFGGKEMDQTSKIFVKQNLDGYRDYFQRIGYKLPKKVIKIVMSEAAPNNAYFDGEQIVLGPKLAQMQDAIYREYTHRVLKELRPDAWAASDWRMLGLLSGLADYFPCSYIGTTKFGAQYVVAFRDELPDEFKKSGVLRDLANKKKFVSTSDAPQMREQHNVGEVWSAALWDIRRLAGCKDADKGCERADKIFLESWRSLAVVPDSDLLERQFATTIVGNIKTSLGEDLAKEASDAFAGRGLDLK